MTLNNTWQYGVRIDNISRDLLPLFQQSFREIEWFDPREKLAETEDQAQRERLMKRWPDLGVVRLILPIGDAFDCERLAELVGNCELRVEDMDVIMGLQLENDTEYSAVPKGVLEVIRKFNCEVTINVTVMR